MYFKSRTWSTARLPQFTTRSSQKPKFLRKLKRSPLRQNLRFFLITGHAGLRADSCQKNELRPPARRMAPACSVLAASCHTLRTCGSRAWSWPSRWCHRARVMAGQVRSLHPMLVDTPLCAGRENANARSFEACAVRSIRPKDIGMVLDQVSSVITA